MFFFEVSAMFGRMAPLKQQADVTTPAPGSTDSGEVVATECHALDGNDHGCTDEDCKPCQEGQTWWPCNVEGLCIGCGKIPIPTGAPIAYTTPEPVVESDPTPAPVASDADVTTSAPEPTESYQSSGAGASYRFHDNTNVIEGTDLNNSADLKGCEATGDKDVRNLPEEKQKCLDECNTLSDCTGVTFHSQGSMLKKNFEAKTISDMMQSRNGFETYVKPTASKCHFYRNGFKTLNKWCASTCNYALEHGFLAGKGDSTAFGTCCWNDCEDQKFAKIFDYACYCDEAADDEVSDNVNTETTYV
jgi:hypothetical protein